ncbi:unnamed protein product, partial [Ectocarpus sp. 12 AP-2014]
MRRRGLCRRQNGCWQQARNGVGNPRLHLYIQPRWYSSSSLRVEQGWWQQALRNVLTGLRPRGLRGLTSPISSEKPHFQQKVIAQPWIPHPRTPHAAHSLVFFRFSGKAIVRTIATLEEPYSFAMVRCSEEDRRVQQKQHGKTATTCGGRVGNQPHVFLGRSQSVLISFETTQRHDNTRLKQMSTIFSLFRFLAPCLRPAPRSTDSTKASHPCQEEPELKKRCGH